MKQLPKHILSALLDGKTSLGEHPAFPPEDEKKYVVRLIQKHFEDITSNIENVDYDALRTDLSNVLSKCRQIEGRNREALERLCVDIVHDMFEFPDDSIKIEAKLVDNVDVSSHRLIPEENEDFSFDDIDDMNYLTDEIYKRRMLNALILGASIHYMDRITDYLKELFEIDSDLPSLYKKILIYNHILIYLEKDTLDKKKNLDGGKVDVNIASGMIPSVKAEALIFPILLEECIKGVFELAISHGLPENLEKAKYVVSKADFRLAEMWDMRLGYPLWRKISSLMGDADVKPNFVLMELAQLDSDNFNRVLQEMFAGTKAGKKAMEDIVSKIEHSMEEDEFNDYIQSRVDGRLQINDDECFTAEELLMDDYEY